MVRERELRREIMFFFLTYAILNCNVKTVSNFSLSPFLCLGYISIVYEGEGRCLREMVFFDSCNSPSHFLTYTSIIYDGEGRQLRREIMFVFFWILQFLIVMLRRYPNSLSFSLFLSHTQLHRIVVRKLPVASHVIRSVIW